MPMVNGGNTMARLSDFRRWVIITAPVALLIANFRRRL
jgi:hypothetical protein